MTNAILDDDDGERARRDPPGGPEGSSSGAGRGGGPRTSAGKAKSSRNALKHGILSSSPVAAGEAVTDWVAHVDGLRASLKPRGAFEEQCVARIAEDLWALNRVTRQVSTLVSLSQRRVDPPQPVKLRRPAWSGEPSELTGYSWPEKALVSLLSLEMGKDDELFGEEVVDDCLRAIYFSSGPFEVESPLEASSAGYLRASVTAAARAQGTTVEAVVKLACEQLFHVMDYMTELERKIGKALESESQRQDRAPRSHLPDDRDYETLLRYKRAHERSLEKWMTLLRRSQEASPA